MTASFDWRIGITTAPRKFDYIDQTIEGAIKAGFHVFEVFHDIDQEGPWKNFKKTLTELSRKEPNLEDPFPVCLVLQDDILLTENLKEYLELDSFIHDEIESGSIMSLYTSAYHHNEEIGWHSIPSDDLPRKCYGALAVMMSRDTAIELLEQSKNGLGVSCKNKTDFWIGKFCQVNERHYLQHSPSFCFHLGIVSSLEHNENGIPEELSEFRQCKEFMKGIDVL